MLSRITLLIHPDIFWEIKFFNDDRNIYRFQFEFSQKYVYWQNKNEWNKTAEHSKMLNIFISNTIIASLHSTNFRIISDESKFNEFCMNLIHTISTIWISEFSIHSPRLYLNWDFIVQIQRIVHCRKDSA